MKPLTKSNKKYIVMALTCLAVMSGFAYYYFFSAFSVSSTTEYLYIDQDDNIDSVFTKLTPIASRHGMQGLSTLVRHSDYPENSLRPDATR